MYGHALFRMCVCVCVCVCVCMCVCECVFCCCCFFSLGRWGEFSPPSLLCSLRSFFSFFVRISFFSMCVCVPLIFISYVVLFLIFDWFSLFSFNFVCAMLHHGQIGRLTLRSNCHLCEIMLIQFHIIQLFLVLGNSTGKAVLLFSRCSQSLVWSLLGLSSMWITFTLT